MLINGITVEMLRIALSHMQHRGAEKLQLRAVSLQKDEMIAVYKVFDTEQVHRVIPANGGGKRMIDGALQKIENGFFPRGAQRCERGRNPRGARDIGGSIDGKAPGRRGARFICGRKRGNALRISALGASKVVFQRDSEAGKTEEMK